ncbi:MAG: hypothetical protein LBU64_05825 [Planctomycetota bacterium]|jgi:hypothetical protein|nr:hypothetical protein [Planctomycetota bacterium]
MAVKSSTTRRFGIFVVSGGVLRAGSNLYWERLGEFENACAKLLAMPEPRLQLDLAEVDFMASGFIGSITNLALKTARMEKKLVIRATLDIGWLFEIMGEGKLVELDII